MSKGCAVYKTADLIGKRWTLLILLGLYKGETKWKRYTRLKDELPEITPKILSARLKELGREGLVVRKVDAKSFPIKCEYSLTRGGEEFVRIIRDMKKWALRWKVRNEFCEKLDCKNCGLSPRLR
ncbi:MAG: helix-turn-helix domain-containing protein [Candidatus Micrarchaeota archaeon]